MRLQRAMNDFVFVRKAPEETISKGGIFLGEREYDTGIVVAVGPGRYNKKGRRTPMWDLEPGQTITFSPNGNAKHRVNGEELTVVMRDSVIGVVEEEA